MKLSEIVLSNNKSTYQNSEDWDEWFGNTQFTGKKINGFDLHHGESGRVGVYLLVNPECNPQADPECKYFVACMYVIQDEYKYPHTEIYVDQDFQGNNLALPMYLYVLQEVGLPLMSDRKQTDAGQALWHRLAATPGINVYVYNTTDNTFHGEYDPKDSGRVYGPEDWRHKIRLVATTDTITTVDEAWSKKYKKSINCSNPKGFSQKAHCQGRKKKTNESVDIPEPDDSFFKDNRFKRTEYAGMKLVYGEAYQLFQIYAYSMHDQAMGAVMFRYDPEYDAYIADDLYVETKFRRQGVASALYDFAKQQLDAPIRRSRDQTDQGAAFWGNKELWEAIADEVRERDFYKADYVNTKAGELRVVAKNITDQYPEQFVVEAFTHGGLRVAYARFVAIGPKEETTQTFLGRFKKKVEPVEFPHLVVGNVTVNQEYRRKGIASAIYNWVRSWGNDIEPSPVQTTAGKEFWKAGAGTKMTENSATPDDIFYMISDIHTGHNDIETDEEFQQWVGSFDKYELKDIPLSKLKVSQSNINADKAKSYIKQKNPPPIVVDGTNYWIIDGHHRVAAALARGDKTIKGYVGLNELAEGDVVQFNRQQRMYRKGKALLYAMSRLGTYTKRGNNDKSITYSWLDSTLSDLLFDRFGDSVTVDDFVFFAKTNPKIDYEREGNRHNITFDRNADMTDIFVAENFADGKKKGKSRPGRVKRAGASCKGSVTDLRAKAKKYSGEKGKMYHWCANMKAGKKKKR